MSTVFPSSMPYDSVEIIDQSGYIEETVVEAPFIPEGPVAFVPFISPRGYGEDNKLQYMSASKLAKYGNPNLKKYGLSLYLAKQVLAAGGTVLGMRVTTDKYAHANYCVYANVKKSDIVSHKVVSNETEDVIHPMFEKYVDGNLEKDSSIYFNEITMSDYTDISTIRVNNDEITNELSKSITIGEDISDVKFTVKDNNGKITELSFNVQVEEIGSDDQPTGNKIDGNIVYKLVPINSVVNIKYTGKSLEGQKTLKDLKTSFIKDYKLMKDTDIKTWDGKEKIIPLFYIAAKGAGTYGNAFKVRITTDESMNDYNKMVGGKGFFYKFIDSDNNAKLDSPISFTFNDDYVYNNESMSVEEVFTKYTENVIMEKASSFDDLLAIVKYYCYDSKKIPNLCDIDIENIDILFGKGVDESVLNIDRTDLKLDQENGIQLSNGTEDINFDFKADPFATALVNAYSGKTTDLIFDHVRYPFQFVFCPSANSDVVDAVHGLVTQNRKITSAYYFVLGSNTVFPATYSEAKTNKPSDVNSYKEMIVPEWARITDTYTGKKTFMPSVYFNAYSIINHWNTKKGRPLAGRLNAIWSGFDVGTVTPSSSDVKQYIENHNAGLNTMIEDGLGNAELYEQITAQPTTSSLSEVNNMQVLHEMVKIALRLAKENRWSDLGEEDISQYKSLTETAISDKLKGCYERMEVIATRESSNGAGRNRILCRVNVKFKDMFKGVSYEFYILAQ